MSLTHIDKQNNPAMVDISDKSHTHRSATALSYVRLPKLISQEISKDGELNVKKGPVFHTAIIAGTMAVKNTSQLIPFCHPIQIENIKITITPKEDNSLLEISCLVKTYGKTGVEMEALTGASICALTIYDMCKALSHEIKITETSLLNKSGGKRLIQDGKVCS